MQQIEAGLPAVNAGWGKIPSTSQFPRLWAVGVCISTFLAYVATLRFQFVHDDRGIIVENPATHSWHAVPGYFASGVWGGVVPGFLANAYRPIYLLWFRINDAIFGPHAAGWHFTSVVAHVVATYCVILLAHRIFGEWPPALFSGVVFGLHPIHIESVAWISGVDDPLVAGLIIPAYLCWLRSRENGDQARRWVGASLALYGVAMFTKEIAIVLPLILFVSLWLDFPSSLEPRPRGSTQRFLQALKVLLPFIALTAAYLTVRMAVLRGFWQPAAHISWLTVVLTWPSLLGFYAKLLLWPVGLSPFYGLEYVLHPAWRNTILPALALLLVAGGLWRWGSHSRSVALMIPWLIVPLLPVLNVQVFGNGNFAHNRYLYLPSVGFAMLVAEALRTIRVGRQYFGVISSFQTWIAIGLALVLGLAINVEDRYYSSDAAFYSLAYSRVGRSYPVIGMDYANTLAEQGDFVQAAGIYRELIKAWPNMWAAYFNLGYMYYQQGDLDSAMHYFSRTATGDPANAAAIFYLGLADLKLHHLDEAEANLRRAIVLAPTASNYHFALGMVLQVKGDGSGAVAEFARELEVNPANQAAAQQAEEIRRQKAGK
ncbi:MAG TPA: tetratricopeptide repeat protein [Terriglobia bacterium]|nr:tetratricopeptide repeat protein [Terriglobia bacterium]